MYFGADSWDAPRSLHEMLIVQDESILSLVPDYRINLIAPGEMSEEELELFTSNFREVMQFIKYSKDTEKLSQLVEENTAFETMDRKAVRVMEEMTGMKIEKEVEEEKVNVCKAIQGIEAVSYTHLRAHETGRNLVCRLLLEKKKKQQDYYAY